jgi:hypothetical protein
MALLPLLTQSARRMVPALLTCWAVRPLATAAVFRHWRWASVMPMITLRAFWRSCCWVMIGLVVNLFSVADREECGGGSVCHPRKCHSSGPKQHSRENCSSAWSSSQAQNCSSLSRSSQKDSCSSIWRLSVKQRAVMG